MRSLSAKQRAFAGLIADGLSGSEAYRRIYSPNGKSTVIAVKASELRWQPGVAGLIAKLQEKIETRGTLSRQCKREMLARMIEARASNGEHQLTHDQLKAIEIDNRLAGHNEPEKIAVSGLGGLLQKIRADAKKP